MVFPNSMNHSQKKRKSASDKMENVVRFSQITKIHNSERAKIEILCVFFLLFAISSIHLPKMEPHFFGFKKLVCVVSNSKIIIYEIDFITTVSIHHGQTKVNFLTVKKAWLIEKNRKNEALEKSAAKNW